MQKEKKRPTRERLMQLFHYEPATGIFTRKVQGRSWAWQDNRKYGAVGAGRVTELGNVVLAVDGANYSAGPCAWLYAKGEWPKRIKYINGNASDLRIDNIRIYDEEMAFIKNRSLTQDRLKELLHYDPKTGWFTWKVHSATYAVGDRAGGLHGKGYRQIGIDYNKYLEHALAFLYMTGKWPEHTVDHKNRIKHDNHWDNLVDATRSEQGHNMPSSRRSKSGYPGVYKHGNKFRSRMDVNKTTLDFGRYGTIAEARVARLLAEIQYFGYCTTFEEPRDSNLPSLDGRTIPLELHTSEVKGMRCDCLSMKDHNGIGHWVNGVSTVAWIIGAALLHDEDVASAKAAPATEGKG